MVDRVDFGNRAAARFAGFARPQLFAGLFLIGCANGLAIRVGRTITEQGWLDAALGTFDISLIIMAACFIGIWLLLRDPPRPIEKVDLVIVALFIALVVPPVTSLSWFAVAMLSLYILVYTDSGDNGRRGAIILLATSVPMLWAPLLLNIFSTAILDFDAMLVAAVLSSDRLDNFVEFADHSGNLSVFPGCSSLPNMAMAFLCWITLNEFVGHKWRPVDFLWGALIVTAVLAVNVARMSLMGLNQHSYQALHTPTGDIIVSAITLGVTLGICVLGLKREIISRA